MFLFVFFFDTKTIHSVVFTLTNPFHLVLEKSGSKSFARVLGNKPKKKIFQKISLQFTKWPLCLTKRNKCLETLNA